MEIRKYQESDTLKLIELFRSTIHTVCKKDYSQTQLDMWAPKSIDTSVWIVRLSNSYTLVAEDNSELLGFASLANEGLVDMFYVSANAQGKGVGTILMNNIEIEAKKRKAIQLRSDVSLTAKPFFKSIGFIIEKEYVKELNGVQFNNAIMTKTLV